MFTIQSNSRSRNCEADFVSMLLLNSLLYIALKSTEKKGLLVRNGVNAETKSFVFQYYKNLAHQFIKNLPLECSKLHLAAFWWAEN